MKYDNQIGILCDIQGPKIRTGKMEEPFEVNFGDKIRVTPDECRERLISLRYHMIH